MRQLTIDPTPGCQVRTFSEGHHVLSSKLRRRLLLAAPAAVATAILVAPGLPTTAYALSSITVDTSSDVVDFGGDQTVADLPGPDGQTSLREAVIAASNTAGADSVGFAIPTSDPGFDGGGFTIGIAPSSPEEQLSLTGGETTIDATTQPGGYPITVSGTEQTKADERVGLVIDSSGNTVRGLRWRLYGTGIRAVGGTGNLITEVDVRDCNNGINLFDFFVNTGHNSVTNSTITGNDRTPLGVFNSGGGTFTGNTVTDNAGTGVVVRNAPETHISGNLISGNASGIAVTNADVTGGSATGNTIVGNAGDGVEVFSDGFTISQNSIADNGGLGIDLVTGREDEFGVTRNSKGGPNYPDRLAAVDGGDTTLVGGRIDAAEPQSVTIELFANEVADPSGHGEGQTFLGTATADAKGRFTATVPGGLAGQYVTATATRADGTTSEFSQAVLVAAAKNKKEKDRP